MPWSRERSGHLSFNVNQNLTGSEGVVTVFISRSRFLAQSILRKDCGR